MGKSSRARDGPKAKADGPDWNKVKAEYLSTDTSLRKLADKYHVPLSAIAARSKSENWIQLREQVKDKTETKLVEKISTSKADALTMVRDTAIETLYALNLAAKNISQILQHPPAPSEDDQNHQKGKRISDAIIGASVADPLRSIASSLKTTQDILYQSYNKLTPAQAETNKINLERLRIQKQMADIKTPTAGEQIHIIITPPEGTAPLLDENGNPRPVTVEDLSG